MPASWGRQDENPRRRQLVAMMRILITATALAAGLGLQAAISSSATAVPADGSAVPLTYSEHLKPLLGRFCVDCHGNERQKADLNLQALGDNAPLIENPKVWERVREMLELREMPPENKPQPTEDERILMTQAISSELAKLDCNGPVNPGRVTIRRLNRSEYNNTIRDLVGVDFKPAADFPSDEVGYGFDNIGDVLSLPPILLEKYLAAAEQIATNAIVARPPIGLPVVRIEGETMNSTANGSLFQDRALSLDTEGEAHFEHAFSQGGEFILRARAFGQQAGPDPARMAVRIDSKELKVFDVPAVESAPGIYEFRTAIEPGKRRLAFAYINNYNVQDHPDVKLRGDRNLILDWVEIKGPLDYKPPPLPATHTRIVGCAAFGHKHDSECAEKILRDFTRRAYRRPVADSEIARLMQFVQMVQAEKGTFEEGIQVAVQAILVSPNFLFRWELDAGQGEEQVRPLNDHEIASRLSYFIWSSMPDDELFQLADKGMLANGETLERQARRMLKDPKARALVDNFAAQWLQIRNLELAAPDPELFPHFDEELKFAMRRETELLFEAVMREDRSILELIDADYTFLNERLAQHYGIEGVHGPEFRKVSLTNNSNRGGILTHGSILTITSNPRRTSPVNRGKWILEQILGTPPPPPPPDVEELSDEEEAINSGSLRQRLELHRAKPECATCHNKMDPLGFALENFDAIGAWRDKDGQFDIDPSGVLPNGKTIQGPNDLKRILTTEATFIRSLSEKMLTFALGRGLEYYDKCAVDDICKALVRSGYGFSTLVTEIVKSEPFLLKARGETK